MTKTSTQPKSSDIPIKVADNIERQAKFEQIVFSEIKGDIIELDADNRFGSIRWKSSRSRNSTRSDEFSEEAQNSFTIQVQQATTRQWKKLCSEHHLTRKEETNNSQGRQSCSLSHCQFLRVFIIGYEPRKNCRDCSSLQSTRASCNDCNNHNVEIHVEIMLKYSLQKMLK